jgi:hypothetical protein
MNLTDLLPIPCVSPDLMKLRSLIVDIQANWFANDFDSGLTFSNPDTWQKCQEAINLLRHRDNSSRSGFSILEIADDYDRLESIFISPSYAIANNQLQLEGFEDCELVKMHRFSAVRVLKEVIDKRNKEMEEKLEIELKAIETESYIEVETPKARLSPYMLDWINRRRDEFGLDPFPQTDEDIAEAGKQYQELTRQAEEAAEITKAVKSRKAKPTRTPAASYDETMSA